MFINVAEIIDEVLRELGTLPGMSWDTEDNPHSDLPFGWCDPRPWDGMWDVFDDWRAYGEVFDLEVIAPWMCEATGRHVWVDAGSYHNGDSAVDHHQCSRCGETWHHVWY
jgi:hypothetical protein